LNKPLPLRLLNFFEQTIMKQFLTIIIVCLTLLASGCDDVDVALVADASMDAIKAVSLTDEAVIGLAREAAQVADKQNRIASKENRYSQRLNKLTKHYGEQDGIVFNFKVYVNSEINAFAMADGTIRIYSGLMDMMGNGELVFVVGHEMGHVVKDHVRKKIRLAYASRAVRKGAASINNEIGYIARSQLGGFVEKLLNAQFSQQEEREADDYGLMFLGNTGYELESAVSALKKLSTLDSNHNFLSSHPAPEKRANRLKAQLAEQKNR
jgi:metalloprotease